MMSWQPWLRAQIDRLLPPAPPTKPFVAPLSAEQLREIAARTDPDRAKYVARCHELVEARQMAGSGPWLPEVARAQLDRPGKFREAALPAYLTQGAGSDIQLMLDNLEWRREVNLSLLEFTRWGIQQIINVSRLHYIKHPWIRRGVNLSAAYVFGQGVEISSPDPDANEVLKEWREINKAVFGQIALTAQERSKSTDGNLFWASFADKENTGQVRHRIIDATEIQDIVTNPEDSTEEWYFRRVWAQRQFDESSGITRTSTVERWYPALNYEPVLKIPTINGVEVEWDTPVYHRKCGGIWSWLFGCPRIFPALEWDREGTKFLEAFASVWAALHQISITYTTKGGQQAIEGFKQQMQTSVGPTSNLLDQNPGAVAGSLAAMGPGSVLAAFKTQGAGGNPSDIKEFRNFVACVLEIPPTWLGDMETSNLSTAKTLDRPTELGFLLKQEEWQEDLVVLATYALKVSAGAASGKLKEARDKRNLSSAGLHIHEAARVMKDCHWVYEAAAKPADDDIEVLADFPSIREGDTMEEIEAIVLATTLGNKGGEAVGIDLKESVRLMSKKLDIPKPDETVEEMFPEKGPDPYERNRSRQPITAPIGKLQPLPGGKPQIGPDGKEIPPPIKPATVAEAMVRLTEALKEFHARPNGHA